MKTAQADGARVAATSTRPGGVRLARVRSTAIDTSRVISAVADSRAGAIDVFVGVVRDHDGGLVVVDVEYHAHPSADRDLAGVAAGVLADFDVHAVAVEHRVGQLEVGEIAVACAVSASHRAEAFEATRALIDRIKEQVPIWKDQGYGGGSRSWIMPQP